MRPRVTLGRLREVLNYDPKTGLFTWVKRIGTQALVGTVAGTVVSSGHVHIGIDRTYYGAHRLAWFYVHGEWPINEIDHKNLCKTDNRLDNLRQATNQQQAANRGALKNNKLGVKGVCRSTLRVRKPQRYRARIRVNNQLIHLGYFSTTEEASEAYRVAAQKHFGEFGRAA